MRGIAFALICSLFLNSSMSYPLDNISSYAVEENRSYETEEIAVSENDLVSENNLILENNLDSENSLVSEKEESLEKIEMENYHIIGETPDGESIAVKASQSGSKSMPVKPFETEEYDWTTMEIWTDYSKQVEQIKQEMINEEGRVYVSSEKDMLALAFLSDQGETFKDIEIIQTEDITFTRTFPGIGHIDFRAGIYGFEGTFDGNGYIFYGLKHIANIGIFPAISPNGVVRNVTLLAEDLVLTREEVEFFCPLTERNLGLIENYYLEGNIVAERGISVWGCGWLNLGIVRDSTIKGSIVAESGATGFFLYNRAGGQILNCYNHCNMECGGASSGIAGQSYGVILQSGEVEPEFVEIMVTINNVEYYPREFFPSLTSEEVKSYHDEKKDITFYYTTPLIKDCYNYGNITIEGDIASGIVGIISPVSYSFFQEENSQIVGIYVNELYAGSGVVVHCANYGNITGDEFIGGIIGQYGELITDCVNYGTIKGVCVVGGIGGTSSSGSTMIPKFGIVRCANYGDVSGVYSTGGILGSKSGIVQDNYNRGNIIFNKEGNDKLEEKVVYELGGLIGSAFFDDNNFGRCYSTGNVEVVGEYCNGLIGYYKKSYPADFYLTGNMEGVENQPCYVTQEWMKSEQALISLGSAFKKDSYGINDGYPILQWQTGKSNKMQVRFVTFGGSKVETQYIYGGEKVLVPDAPVRKGAEFEGWYTDPSYTTKWNFASPISSSMNLYAKWNDPLKKQRYKVTFDMDGGIFDVPYGFSEYIYVWEGRTLEFLEPPIKEEYSFQGWGINGSTSNLWDIEKDKVTEDVVLKAIWKEEGLIVVRLYPCGADDKRLPGYDYDWVYRSYAGKFDFETILSKEGYDFGGWFTEENGKGKEYTSDTRIYGNISLYAHWISKERYQVTFDSCGGSEVAAIDGIIPGNCVDLPVPEKKNSVFMGWYTMPGGRGERINEETSIKKNMTLYAFWQEDIVVDDYHIQALQNQIYTGDKIMPEVKVFYKNELLKAEEDYTLKYVNCVAAGTAKVYVYLKEGNKKFILRYQIIEKNIENQDVSCKVYNPVIDNRTGLAMSPIIEVSYQGKLLQKNVDYSVKIDEGDGKKAAATITGKGNFSGTREVYYSIKGNSIANVVVRKIEKQSYTGKEIKPKVEITDKDGTILKEGEDYECSYTKNINPGKAVLEVRGIGPYGGSRKITFNISKKVISEPEIEVSKVITQVYDSMAKQPQISVSYNNMILEQGKDYTIKYSNNKNVSQKACIIIKGKGSYSGQRKVYFEIKPKDIDGVSVTVDDALYRNGKEVKPIVVVKDGNKTLRKNKDYTLSYSQNMQLGVGKVNISGKGNYTGETREYNFRIVSDFITKAKVSKILPVTYCGNEFAPKVEVFVKNELLTEGKDYVLEYPKEENINAPKGSFYVVGQGIYGGRKKITYVINKKQITLEDSAFSLQSIEAQNYIGTKITPKISISYNGIALEEGKDYKLRYQNNVNAGNKAVISIQGIGNFKGTWKTNFTILPAPVTDTLIETQDVVYKEGKSSKPKITVKYGNKKLKEKKDYLVIYDNNTKCEDGTISVKGIGNFAALEEQTVKVPYHVYQTAIGKVKCEKLKNPTIVQDEILEPEIRLSFAGKELKEDVDYILEYLDNTRPGKGKVIIRGIGSFGGTKSISFKINKK